MPSVTVITRLNYSDGPTGTRGRLVRARDAGPVARPVCSGSEGKYLGSHRIIPSIHPRDERDRSENEGGRGAVSALAYATKLR